MAYTRDLGEKCQRCPKRATVEVFNHCNAPSGKYCRKCGAQKLKELERMEKGADEVRRKLDSIGVYGREAR